MKTDDLGNKIQEIRKLRKLSQEKLAQKSGISYSAITKIERGAIENPSFEAVLKIARALELDLNELAQTETSPPDLIIEPEHDAPIDFVYVDMNGVMVRFFQRAFVSLAEKCNRSPDVVESAFWHYNDAVNRGDMTTAEFNKALGDHLGMKPIDWEKEYLESVEAIEPMHECLRQISKDTKVGLLTNTMPGLIDKMLELGLLPDVKFSAIVDSSVVGSIKPEPKIYQIAEEMAGKHGSQILFLDDSRSNLVAAERLGWHVLWFDDYRPEESVSRLQAALKL